MGRRLMNVHPGEVLLQEFIEPLGLSQNLVARETHVPPRRINEICLGKRSISPDTAIRLARYFGTTPNFWLGLQQEFDLEEAQVENDYSVINPHQALPSAKDAESSPANATAALPEFA